MTLPKSENKKSAAVIVSLSSEQIMKNNSANQLVQFLREDRFPFRKECENLIVFLPRGMAKTNLEDDEGIFYVELSLLSLLKASEFFYFLNSVLFSIKNQMLLSRFKPRLIRECVKKAISDGVQDVYTRWARNSFHVKYLVGTLNYIEAGLPAHFARDSKDLTRVMLWYSTNTIPIGKMNEGFNRWLPEDFEKLIDTHYVWDEYQKMELEAQGAKNVVVKGSMVFLPRLIGKGNIPVNGSLRITFFDVTPIENSEDNFYSTSKSILTLSSLILELRLVKERLQREIEVFVKSKRAPSSIHSQEYLEFLKICEAQNKISLLEADTNLYETISLSQIVLAPPFSGPVVIASELEIPCAYYFLPDTEWLLPKSHHGVEVIREVHDLHNFLLSALSKN